jgi:hypothetical protein
MNLDFGSSNFSREIQLIVLISNLSWPLWVRGESWVICAHDASNSCWEIQLILLI